MNKRFNIFLVRFLLLLLCAFNAAAACSVDIEDSTGSLNRLYDRSRALLIGNTNYSGAWEKLKAVPGELKNLKDTLEKQCFEVELHLDLKGTDALALIHTFLSQQAGPRSRKIVYLSGHGWTDPEGQGFFVGVDATGDPGVDQKGLLAVGIIRAMYAASTALHTLIVMDSCYSGALLQTKSLNLPTRFKVEVIKQRAFQMLASGTKDQRVPGESVFIKHFIAGINGSAAFDTRKSFVTFKQLAAWLTDEVSNKSNQTPVYGDYPVPAGEMIFVPPAGPSLIAGRTGAPTIALPVPGSPPIPSLPSGSASQAQTRPATRSVIPVIAQKEAEQGSQVALVRGFSKSFPKTEVYYYRKAADSLKVVDALNRIGANYVARPPELPDKLKTNGIGCGPNTPVAAIRELAAGLIDAGVPIQRIGPYSNSAAKAGRLEVFSTTYVAPSAPSLTRAQIDAMSGCMVLTASK